MGILDKMLNDRRLLLGTVVLILLASAFVRFYHIEWSFSNNGIDEGIMIERARLVGQGYSLYSDLPCDQAPLVFYIGSPFGGDVVTLRSISAIFSLVAIGAVMESARRIKGNAAMLIAGLLISFDFAFLRESRLFSLDGMSASLLALSLLPFVIYSQKRSRLALATSGLLIGLSTAAKLFGALGLIGMLLFMLLDARAEKRKMKNTLADVLVLVISSAIPLALFMLYLGPGDVLQGMVFNQGQRTFEPWLKLSLAAYFGLNVAYLLPLAFAKRSWSIGKEMRLLLCVTGVILAFMVVQPLIFLHHLVMMSPCLAILAGAFISDAIEVRKRAFVLSQENREVSKKNSMPRVAAALFLVTILVSAGLAGYGLVMQKEPPQMQISRYLQSVTDEGDWVICGDPLIGAYADRNIPPGVVNVAYRQHPDLTLDDIAQAISEYNVSVVLLSWRLLDMDGMEQLLAENHFVRILPEADTHWSSTWADYHAVLDFFQDDMGPVYIYWRSVE